MNSSKIAVALAASLFLVTASAQDKGGPSDPQIAGIVVAANQIDIDAGKLAKSRTRNKQEPERRCRSEHRKPQKPEERGVRQGVCRPRGGVSPGGAGRGRQGPDPERQERRAERPHRQGPPRLCGASGSRQDGPVLSGEEIADEASCVPRPGLRRRVARGGRPRRG